LGPHKKIKIIIKIKIVGRKPKKYITMRRAHRGA